MIDFENEIFTEVATELRTNFPGIYVSGELNLNPSVFPCVYIEEADNSSLLTTRDSSSNENHVVLMYEVNVFSNKQQGKKQEAKAIFKVVDDVFSRLGFTRMARMPFGFASGTAYRIAGRYSAIADSNQRIYRR